MRSTRASAAWAGIALATSFLSVTIVGTQPHTNSTRAIAESVAITSTSDVVTSDEARKRAAAAESSKTASAPR